MKVGPAQSSGINFDWVLVRELRFVDNPASYERAALRDLVANVHVHSALDPARRSCRTTVRLTMNPPDAQPDQFQMMVAAVEGQFSVPEGAAPVLELEQFASRQAPAILMPFVRDAIAHLTASSRFGTVLVPPINVIALMEKIAAEEGPVTQVAGPVTP